jgi:hypothetical protein
MHIAQLHLGRRLDTRPMTRSSRPITALLLLGSLLAAVPASASASAHTLGVGYKHACYSTIPAALDAARDGDTVMLAPGRFAGGIGLIDSCSASS